MNPGAGALLVCLLAAPAVPQTTEAAWLQERGLAPAQVERLLQAGAASVTVTEGEDLAAAVRMPMPATMSNARAEQIRQNEGSRLAIQQARVCLLLAVAVQDLDGFRFQQELLLAFSRLVPLKVEGEQAARVRTAALVLDGVALGWARAPRASLTVDKAEFDLARLQADYAERLLQKLRTLSPEAASDQVVELAEESQRFVELPAWALARLGSALAQKGRTADAIACFDRCWNRVEGSKDMQFQEWLWLGDAERALDRSDRADRAYEHAAAAFDRENSVQVIK